MKKSLHSHSPLRVQVRIQYCYCPFLEVPFEESWGKLKVQNPHLAFQHFQYVGTSVLCHSQGEPRGSPGFFPVLENTVQISS